MIIEFQKNLNQLIFLINIIIYHWRFQVQMFIQYLKTFINSTYSIFKTFILILILLDNITAPKQFEESV